MPKCYVHFKCSLKYKIKRDKFSWGIWEKIINKNNNQIVSGGFGSKQVVQRPKSGSLNIRFHTKIYSFLLFDYLYKVQLWSGTINTAFYFEICLTWSQNSTVYKVKFLYI